MKRLMLYITEMLLIMLLTSCVTTSREKIIVPTITFPTFPELEMYDKIDGKTVVPDDYIIRLAEYKIMIAETEKNYNEIKALYENERSINHGRAEN